LRETLLDFASKQATGRRSLVLYDRAVASSPTLRGRVQERVQADITTVATAVAERRGQPAADESCALLAAVVLVTCRRALTRWLQGPANGNLRRVLADEFALRVAHVAPSTATADGHRRRPSLTGGPTVPRSLGGRGTLSQREGGSDGTS
jgi:hypothetical protein